MTEENYNIASSPVYYTFTLTTTSNPITISSNYVNFYCSTCKISKYIDIFQYDLYSLAHQNMHKIESLEEIMKTIVKKVHNGRFRRNARLGQRS